LALPERLGHGFSANGDIIAFGYGARMQVNAIGVGHPAKADVGPVGTCVAGQIGIPDPAVLDNELYLQEGVMPSALAPLLPVAFIPGGRLLGAAQSLIKGVYHGPFARLHTFFAVSHDTAEGEIRLEDDRVTVHWPDVAKQEVYRRLDTFLERAVQTNGAKYIKNPLAGSLMGNKPATAHPLGGCGMGETRDSGVVNHKCQVFTGNGSGSREAVHEGLYVCDGASIPRSLGVNPLFTITGIAERAMMHLAADRQWRFDDAPVKTVS
ncbi:MAG: GMC oxidoreductase, partial [Hyphomicrobiales bacterium]